jgi:hypothetical protein
MNVCMYVMYVCMYLCMFYVYVCLCIYVCTYNVSMYVCFPFPLREGMSLLIINFGTGWR